MKEKFYITTALPYVNDSPHIGHVLEFIQADTIARFFRQKGDDVYFLTGTDEHGTKIARKARENGITPKELADKYSKEFKNLKKTLNLSWNNFIRTTDKKNHYPGVIKMWKGLEKSGDIYKKIYRGLYCYGCEAFLSEKDIVNGKCPTHQKEPGLIEEENYFFRLSAYSKTLKKKIENKELEIVPEWRANEILSLIDKGLEDVSFSRPSKKLSWGIPVPGDESQTIYVWADALTNYISAIGYGREEKEFERWWPADTQVIGKDILRFHAAIWPAMLIATNLPIPKKLFVHGFITIDGQKMSKSLGNVISADKLINKLGPDALRYYFLREMSPFEDGNFSWENFYERYNSDLANGLGNFASRVISLADKFGKIKNDFSMMELLFEQKIKSAQKNIESFIKDFKFNNALSEIWNLISEGDSYVNSQKPWSKENTEAKNEKTIYNLLILLNAIGIFLSPFMPDVSGKITKNVSIKGKNILIKKTETLFPRKSTQIIFDKK